MVLDLLGALLEDDAEVAVGFVQGQQDGGGYERVAVYGDRLAAIEDLLCFSYEIRDQTRASQPVDGVFLLEN